MNVKTTLLAVAFGLTGTAVASEATDTISQKLTDITGFAVESVKESSAGLYEIVTDKGIFYATEDGKHLFNGSLHAFEDGLLNLTQQRKVDIAEKRIDKIKNDFVSYPAANEKHELMVFFDTTCGYCRKMHSEMSRYNALGITINYAMWPRQGVYMRGSNVYTQSYKNMESIVCSSNPAMSMNMVMRDTPIEQSSCDNTIEDSFNLGQWLEVSGTPAVYDMEGNLVARGYLPPEAMLKTLEGRG